jgi:prefoldin alpha subunit
MVEKKIDNEQEQLFQEKYAELYNLDLNIRQVQQQLNAVNQQLLEVEAIIQSLESLKDIDKDADAFCMLTPGIFVKSKITDNEKVLLNVGGKAVVEKSVDEAKELLLSQSVELDSLSEELNIKLDEMSNKALKIQEEFKIL